MAIITHVMAKNAKMAINATDLRRAQQPNVMMNFDETTTKRAARTNPARSPPHRPNTSQKNIIIQGTKDMAINGEK